MGPAADPSWIRPAPRAAILQDDAGHPHRVEPGGHFFAFQLPVKIPVAPAGADHHRRSGVLISGRRKHGDRRLDHVCDQPRRADQRRLVNPAGFLPFDPDVTRHLSRPQLDHHRIRRRCANRRNQGDEDRKRKNSSAHALRLPGTQRLVLPRPAARKAKILYTPPESPLPSSSGSGEPSRAALPQTVSVPSYSRLGQPVELSPVAH